MNPRREVEMKTTRKCRPVRGRWLGGALLLGLCVGCKDAEPCDPGQEERSANACYAPSPGSAGSGADVPDASTDSGPPSGGGFAIGQPCSDTAGSSDCGGVAPICAPLPSGPACTQIMCLDGEPNAGVCPDDWPCTQLTGYPSTCLNL